jgi:pimeloyl-ACP methyl ester carboxylesterase
VYLPYPSTVQPGLTLYADFKVPAEPRRLLVNTHGWHGQIKKAHSDNVPAETPEADWLSIAVEMRGRGDSGGKPDCNGWELQDVVDAVHFARREFRDKILDPHLVTLIGGSGGGGNVMGLVGKFPDFFCRARVECGIGDYGLWYRNDTVGEFRDEMDVWMGTTPDIDPEAYASRGGATTAGNLCTPLLIFHGDSDNRVPVEQSRVFVDAARRAGKGHLVSYFELKGVGNPGHYGGATPAQNDFRVKTGETFIRAEPQAVAIPEKAVFMVGGFIRTRHFEVELESINRVAELHVDLTKNLFKLYALKRCSAKLRVRLSDGRWENRELASC